MYVILFTYKCYSEKENYELQTAQGFHGIKKLRISSLSYRSLTCLQICHNEEN